MPLPSLDDLMSMGVAEGFDSNPVPIDQYNAVITGAEVANGAKGPYIKIETTIHDEEHRGRKVWKNAVSFSEKALKMPGGVANLLQTTKPEIDRDIDSNELPAAVAAAVLHSPIVIDVDHEQVKRNGVDQFLADGQPELRATIRQFIEADADFISAIEAEAAGVDDDLPF